MWQTKLILLYCAVCDNSSIIEREMQRQSNNFRPQFSDEECITVYLWGICQRRFEQRTIYDYTKNYLLDWFPKLPSYAAFSRRLNFLAPAFQDLVEEWLSIILEKEVENTTYIVDSCPVFLAKGPRSGHAKVAGELCAKSYNSSRKEWYYGVKLHAFLARKPGRLPAPMGLSLSGAAVHDLKPPNRSCRIAVRCLLVPFMQIRPTLTASGHSCCRKSLRFRFLRPAKNTSPTPFVPGTLFPPSSVPFGSRLSVFSTG